MNRLYSAKELIILSLVRDKIISIQEFQKLFPFRSVTGALSKLLTLAKTPQREKSREQTLLTLFKNKVLSKSELQTLYPLWTEREVEKKVQALHPHFTPEEDWVLIVGGDLPKPKGEVEFRRHYLQRILGR